MYTVNKKNITVAPKTHPNFVMSVAPTLAITGKVNNKYVIVLYFVPRLPDIFVRLVLILWNVYFATERLKAIKKCLSTCFGCIIIFCSVFIFQFLYM